MVINSPASYLMISQLPSNTEGVSLIDALVLNQSQSLPCFPQGRFVCELKREVCFAIKFKDGVESARSSAWILYVETVDVFPFLFL